MATKLEASRAALKREIYKYAYAFEVPFKENMFLITVCQAAGVKESGKVTNSRKLKDNLFNLTEWIDQTTPNEIKNINTAIMEFVAEKSLTE